LRRAAWLVVSAVASCTLDTGVFAGKTCDTDVDCPEPYTCAQVRPEARTCELVRGVDVLDTSGNNPAYYCSGDSSVRDVHAVVADTCASNCHGSDMGYPGVPHTFRLDIYDTIPGFLGAKSEASQMKSDVDNGIMPPMGSGIMGLGTDDKAILTRWVNAGTPFHPAGVNVDNQCGRGGDGGVPDGGSGDAGTSDAGSSDAGDGG